MCTLLTVQQANLFNSEKVVFASRNWNTCAKVESRRGVYLLLGVYDKQKPASFADVKKWGNRKRIEQDNTGLEISRDCPQSQQNKTTVCIVLNYRNKEASK